MIEARKDRRAPASLKVKYKSDTVDGLVEQLGGDVSRAGIFIKTKKPLEPGSLLKFEFQLQNGEPVIHGVGRVAWRRTEQAARPALPPGMGIKFIKLNGDSRSVVEQIEAKHGAGSRYEQTDGAELAPSISSLPPSSNGATGEDQTGAFANDNADPAVARRVLSSSPPLREARVSSVKATAATSPSFRAPPPASSSVPPARSAASVAPKGALGAATPSRRTAPARNTSRDASEFLATAFSVGGAGREVRTAAHEQAERARQDPRSVDLANELFGDLGGGAKPKAEAALDADPVLGKLHLNVDAPPTAEPLGRQSLDDLVNDPSLNARGSRSNRPPAGSPADQLSLSLPKGAADSKAQARTGNGRVVAASIFGLLCVAGAVAVFSLQRTTPAAGTTKTAPVAPAAAPPAAKAETSAAMPPQGQAEGPAKAAEPVAVNVEWAVSSEPPGAEVTVDGQSAGATPVSLKLTEGKTVEVALRSPGFVTKRESVSVTQGLSPRSFALEPLPYELVVNEPVGATVKVGTKSAEAPSPLSLGVLASGVNTLTVVIEKAGFQRVTRKVQRADFHENESARRAELSVTLAPLPAPRRPAPRAAVPAQPAQPLAPPEPENGSAAPVVQVMPAKEAAPAPPPDPAPAAEAPVPPEP
jgi:uncharacterized protein (TIGR02266 family)